MLPQVAGPENAFQVFTEFWSMDFYAIGINLFVIGKKKNVLIVMVPILINKDVIEPSYYDVKFRVWNHYYFYTNLIVNSGYFTMEDIWTLLFKDNPI